jgi:glycosyltransferase involved in cell wall biosynthesis
MPPDVTVVVATRNRPSVLPRALESIRSQGGVSVEAIVVDDGSEVDQAAEVGGICEARADVRLVRLGVSRGPSAARNAGLADAQGRYFCTLDDDNEFLPGKLAAQVEALGGSSGTVAVTGVELTSDGGPPDVRMPGLARASRLDDGSHPFATVSARVFVHTYLLPTELMRRVGSYDEALRWGEHTELFLRLRRVALFVGIEAIGTRVHRDADLEHASRDWRAKADGIRHIMEVHPDDFERSRTMRAEWFDVLGVTLLREGDRAGARRAFASAVAARPFRASALRHLAGAATHSERLLGGGGM